MNADRAIATSLAWRLTRSILRRFLSRAAHRVLANYTLTDTHGRSLRWLQPEIGAFVNAMETEAAELRPLARLETLPSFGNRLMVELAIFTAAANRSLRRLGVEPDCAHRAVADLGWDVYRRMLALSSFPARVLSRDPGRRLRWTIRLLLRFPFDARGAPGYAVESRVEGDNIVTHFTHCPPHGFVRRLSEEADDPEALQAFRLSWCLYDWPGADLIAGDGLRGHYRRPHTLSHGDAVCDMCWVARAAPPGSPRVSTPAGSHGETPIG